MKKLFLFLIILWVVQTGIEARVRIRMGTAAPKGSPWHRLLQEMGAEWKKATKGEVTLNIYAGGVLGDENAMIRKMRIGQIQAAAISDAGLAQIDRGAYALMVPGMFEDYAEWDYVRSRANPDMEKKLRGKGFVVLTWSSLGWVHFFSKEPLVQPEELRRIKLAASAADPIAVEIMKWARLNPVPITLADMVTGLQTGLIDAFYFPIILAESSNLYRYAKNMSDLKWAPLQGALVVTEKTWDQIPESHQNQLLSLARETGKQLQKETRRREEASLEAMKKRGLKVWEIDAETRKRWQETANNAYPRVRNELVTPRVFDQVKKWRDEYRNSLKKGSR
jgi:TRAP-type C4-dicarboxylate transport system substrate-binding protein